jgi:hypothetical protein
MRTIRYRIKPRRNPEIPANQWRQVVIPRGFANSNPSEMYCPKCGEPLKTTESLFVCERGQMQLSESMAERLDSGLVSKTEEAEELHFDNGGCGGSGSVRCGVLMNEEWSEAVMCPRCWGNSGKYLRQLSELHPHKGRSMKSPAAFGKLRSPKIPGKNLALRMPTNDFLSFLDIFHPPDFDCSGRNWFLSRHPNFTLSRDSRVKHHFDFLRLAFCFSSANVHWDETGADQ